MLAVKHRWGIVTVGSTFFPAAPEADENLITLYRTKMLASGVAPDEFSQAGRQRSPSGLSGSSTRNR